MIVDDEPLAREGLRLLLAEHPDIQVVGEAGNAGDALELVEQVDPDLVFLDVQMPGTNGLDLAAALPDGCTPAIVFVTAYDEFALKAFEVHALDYLLKPISEHRLAEAIRRARVQHELGTRQLRPLRERPTKLSIRDGDSIVFVPVEDIDWIEAADYYVEIHAGPRSYLMRESLQRLEVLLDDRFIRIHRSRLVNRERVREVRWENRSKMVVVTDTGVTLEVARSCRAKLDLRAKLR
jgi:two-component system LytT family response regulator